MKKRLVIFLVAFVALFGAIAPVANAGREANNENCLTTDDGIPNAWWMGWDYKTAYEYLPGKWCVNNNPDDSTNHFRWVFQGDGNLVVYDRPKSGGRAVWASNTYNTSSTFNTLKQQTDGNIVIYKRVITSPGVIVGVAWASGKWGNPETVKCYKFYASIRGIFDVYTNFVGNLIIEERTNLRPSPDCPGTKSSTPTRIWWKSNYFK